MNKIDFFKILAIKYKNSKNNCQNVFKLLKTKKKKKQY